MSLNQKVLVPDQEPVMRHHKKHCLVLSPKEASEPATTGSASRTVEPGSLAASSACRMQAAMCLETGTPHSPVCHWAIPKVQMVTIRAAAAIGVNTLQPWALGLGLTAALW